MKKISLGLNTLIFYSIWLFTNSAFGVLTLDQQNILLNKIKLGLLSHVTKENSMEGEHLLEQIKNKIITLQPGSTRTPHSTNIETPEIIEAIERELFQIIYDAPDATAITWPVVASLFDTIHPRLPSIYLRFAPIIREFERRTTGVRLGTLGVGSIPTPHNMELGEAILTARLQQETEQNLAEDLHQHPLSCLALRPRFCSIQ